MALLTTEHPSPVHLLADAVALVRAAAGPRSWPVHPAAAASLRVLLDELDAATDSLAETLDRRAPAPTPLAVVPSADAAGGRTARPGSLRVTTTGDGVRLAGRGPGAEGDLVRAALHQRAGGPGSDAQERLGQLLWTALVAMSRDGLDPPTAVPTPLGGGGHPW